jgi:hypothetical protein
MLAKVHANLVNEAGDSFGGDVRNVYIHTYTCIHMRTKVHANLVNEAGDSFGGDVRNIYIHSCTYTHMRHACACTHSVLQLYDAYMYVCVCVCVIMHTEYAYIPIRSMHKCASI